ncbi:sulfotransferase family protein [Aspergillus saccharolyticus JOP 1030-1]|uniref:NAD dependent epimerase/dehydratase n=1 Tax=Aspergillus saccharolyticus JOP 1030-1 TaxID=1450539 RepID=A0A318Z9M7_9EURO|nr:NAD dependent epimerase/dehydratase [Aspergillus saccharolyticus JOP 1030-1]PYH43127.1 NAD dependent epimerase/dehydratase [Aspergillus saccharolyticus JOP 1030-1]
MGQSPSSPQPNTQLQVIGAGLSRTGTASLSAALAHLLNGPVYHGGTQITAGPPTELPRWNRLLRHWLRRDEAATLSLLREITTGYAAITDAPASHLVPELLTLYPNAKVVVTVRDRQAWIQSVDTLASVVTPWFLWAVLLPLPGMRHFMTFISLVRAQWGCVYEGKAQDKAWVYHRHLEWLKEVVPADQLVVFDVKDGWELLCRGLGVEVPPKDVPFPRINDAKAMEQGAADHIRRGLVRWAVGLGVLGVGLAWWWRWR